jgi:aminopeptidase N
MQRMMFVVIVLLLLIDARAQNKIDVLHYQYNIELSDKSDTIKGKAFVQVKFLDNTNRFSLDLTSPNGKGKGMIAYRVLCNNEAVSSTHGHDSLYISFPFTARKDEVKTYEIFYQGIPTDGLIISKNKYGKRTFFSDNWPNRAHNWIPCNDNPADKASSEFIVVAPAHYKVISNGVLTEETNLSADKKLTHWKEDTPLPTKVMVIGVADFAIDNTGEVNGIPVSSWVFADNEKEGFYDYAPAKDILSFFMNYIGPYPYKKLANVQSKTIFGGMENASAIFYFENSVSGQRKDESLLSHEIVHQWFGDMATEKSFPHLWLSEGFATYLTHIYIESKYGTDSLNHEMRNDRDNIIGFAKDSNKPVVDSTSPLMSLLNANSYQKGGWVLHMLRRELGDTVFHQIIRNYYAAYAGRNADTRDFEKICEETSGKNLQTFFQQWLYTPGLPKLDVQWKYDEKTKNIAITVTQLQGNLFEFPLEIQLQGSSGKSQWETLSVNKKTQQFTFAAKEKIEKAYLDTKTSLLFEGSVSQGN